MAKKYDKAPNVVIYRTKNYDIFKDVEGNRPLRENHLENLMESIQKADWTPNIPALVNENMQVIDGQHRLKIAEAREAWFYFTIGESASEKDVILLNTSSENWKQLDYLKYYLSQGIKDYEILAEFRKKYKTSIGNAGALLTLMEGDKDVTFSREAFKAGHFKVIDEALAHDVMDEVRRYEQYVISPIILRSRPFITAIWRIMDDDNLDLDDVYERFTRQGTPLYRADTTNDYLKQLEDGYNTGLRNRVRLY
jgi:hypothetical protein